jgi:AcrR family transcriptional regulator
MDLSNNEILKIVLKLYTRYGIKSVTMDDVSRELGISKKTLYQFVHDKNELVEKAIDYQCKERMLYMKSLNLDKLPALKEVVEVGKMINKTISAFNPSFHYDLSKYYHHIYKKMMKINRESMAESMLHNLKKGKAEGFYRQNLNEEIIVKMHIANVENLAGIDFYNTQNVSPEEVQKELFTYHMHAILTPEGLKEYNHLLETDNI